MKLSSLAIRLYQVLGVVIALALVIAAPTQGASRKESQFSVESFDSTSKLSEGSSLQQNNSAGEISITESDHENLPGSIDTNIIEIANSIDSIDSTNTLTSGFSADSSFVEIPVEEQSEVFDQTLADGEFLHVNLNPNPVESSKPVSFSITFQNIGNRVWDRNTKLTIEIFNNEGRLVNTTESIYEYRIQPGKPVTMKVDWLAPNKIGQFSSIIQLNYSTEPETEKSINTRIDFEVVSEDSVEFDSSFKGLSTLEESGPDLSIYKSHYTGEFYPGQEISYWIYWTNQGTTSAENVSITDTLPPLLSYVDYWGYSYNPDYTDLFITPTIIDNTVTWDLGTVEPGWYGYIIFTAHISSEISPGSTLTNNAEVVVSPGDIDLSNNISSWTSTVPTPAPDMHIDKWVGSGNFSPGFEVSYTLYWANDGVEPASDVTITDTLPTSLIYMSSTGERYTPDYSNEIPTPTIDGNTISWTLGDIEPGWYGYIYITVQVSPEAEVGTSVTNQADISIAIGEIDTDDNLSSTTDTIISPAPDLYISKWSEGNFFVGNQATYFIYWSNEGTAIAESGVITDTFPDFLSFVSYSGYSYSPEYTETIPEPTINGNIITWNYGDIEPGWWGYIFLTIEIAAEAEGGSSITNQVEISSTTAEADNSNNFSSWSTTLYSPIPDMYVQKWSSGNFLPGDQITYSVYWENEGTDTASNVVITDSLPESINYVGYYGESYTPGYTDILPSPIIEGNTISWDYGEIEPGWSGYIYITAQVSAEIEFGITVTNQVEVSISPGENDTSDNFSSSADTILSPVPDMYIQKWSSGSFMPGTQVYYGIYWTNEGSASAENVTITDILPDSILYNGYYGDSYTPDFTDTMPIPTIEGNTIIFDYGDIEPGWSGYIYLYGQVATDVEVGSSIINQAESNIVSGEDDTSDNISSITNTVNSPIPDMRLSKYLDSGLFYPGNEVVYQLYWHNQGAAVATNIYITDTLPQELTYVSSSGISYSPDYAVGLPEPTINEDTITWDFGDIEPNWSGYIQVTAEVSQDAIPGITITNHGEVSISPGEINTGNNSSDRSDTILTPEPDMHIDKWSNDSLYLGKQSTYEILWFNEGSEIAYDVVLTDVLPDSVNYLSSFGESYTPEFTDSIPTPIIEGNTLTWDMGDIEPGWYGNIYIVVQVNPDAVVGSTATNQAEINVVSNENDTGDNTSAASDIILAPPPDMGIYKYLNSGTFYPGNEVIYGLYWQNYGIETAQDVIITDTLPDYLTYVGHSGISYSPDSTEILPTPTVTGNEISWNYGDIEPGWYGYIYITVEVSIDVAPETTVTNQSSVSISPYEDTIENNYSSRSDTILTPEPDVSITKWVESDPIFPGHEVTYGIAWSNDGTGVAQDVVITDVLPDSMTFLSQSGFSYTPGFSETIQSPSFEGNTIIWDLGNIKQGWRGEIYFLVQVAQNASPGEIVTNQAEISVVPYELNTSNNSSTQTNTIIAPTPDLKLYKNPSGYLPADSEVIYELVYSNNTNDQPADNTILTETLPPGVEFLRASWWPAYDVFKAIPIIPTISGNVLEFDLGTIPGRESPDYRGVVYITVYISAAITPPGTSLTNQSCILTPLDTDPSNNCDEYSGNVVNPTRDLYVSTYLYFGYPVAGNDFRIRTYFDNNGNASIEGVELTQTLPLYATFVSAEDHDGQAIIPETIYTNETGREVLVWDIGTMPGEWAPGSYQEIIATVALDPSTPEGTLLLNEVSIFGIQPDVPDNYQNFDSFAELSMLPFHSVSISKNIYQVQSDYLPGTRVSWRLTYQNNGNVPEYVTITDTLPLSLTYDSAYSNYDNEDWTRTVDGNIVTWTNPNLPADYSGSLYISANINPDIPPTTTIANVAEISSEAITNPIVASNEIIVQGPEIAVTPISLDFGDSYPGFPLTRVLTINNEGVEWLWVSEILSDSNLISLSQDNINIPSGESSQIIVTLTPDQIGQFSGSITLNSDDYDTPSLIVPVVSTVLDPPVIEVDPISIEATIQAGETVTHSLQITNAGLSELNYYLNFHHQEGSSGDNNVAVLGADYGTSYSEDIVSKLQATGQFDNVTFINVRTTTPTLPELRAYRSVLVYSNSSSFSDATALGDVLADYADWGGGVVVLPTALRDEYKIQGRFLTDGYYTIDPLPSWERILGLNLGTVADPSHQVMAGISSFNGGRDIYRLSGALTDGAKVIAFYNNTEPLVVEKVIQTNSRLVRRIDLNFFPASSDVSYRFWDSTTDGAMLMANALTYTSQPNYVTSSPVRGTIPAGENHTVNINLRATDLVSGTYSADLAFTSNDPANAFIVVPITMQVGGEPQALVTPSSLNFHISYIGYSTTIPFTIENSGTSDLVISSITSSDAALSALPEAFTVPPGDNQQVSVYYSPSSTNLLSAVLALTTNDPINPTITIDVIGEAVEPPIIDLEPTIIEETLSSGETLSRMLSINNLGLSDLSFEITDETDNPPGSIHVAILGPVSSSYTDDIIDKLQTAGIFDNVTHINVADYTPSLVELQNYRALMVFNSGGFANPTELGDVLADYVDWGGGVVVMQFALSNNNEIQGRFLSDSYYVIDPLNSTYERGNYLYLGNIHNPNHPVMQGVNSFEGGYYSYYSSGSLSPDAQIIAEYNNGVPLVVEKRLQIGSNLIHRVDLNFFPPSSDAHYRYWQSDTDGARLMTNALRYVAKPTLISISPGNGTVPVGESLPVELLLDSSGLASGTYLDNLVIENQDPANPLIIVPITMEVTGEPVIAVSPSSLDFGEIYIGYPKTLNLLIENNGAGNLQISDITTESESLLISSTSFDLPGFEWNEIEITYNPLTVEELSATITLYSNDPSNPMTIVDLSGTAIEPPSISVIPESFVINQDTGLVESYSLLITNNGEGPLNFDLTATNEIAGFEPASGSVGGQEEFLVDVVIDTTALLPGQYNGEIFVKSNDPGNPEISIPITMNVILALPEKPSEPNPPDGETNIQVDQILTWQASLHATSYNIYLWENGQEKPLSPTITGLTSASYDQVGNFAIGVTHHWQVIAKNVMGSVEGPEWSFTTESLLPDLIVALNPVPTSAAIGYPIEITWEISNNGNLSTDTSWWYDQVYLSSNPTFDEATAIDLGDKYNSTSTALEPGESFLKTATFDLPADISGDYYIFILTDYYNNIRESNENNNIDRSTSTINIYLDLPEAPFNPDPQDGEINVRIDKDISWQGSPNTSAYDLYIWEEGQTKPSTPTVTDLTQTIYYPPSNFIATSTYYWQVVAKNVMGDVSGPEWSFTTESLLPDLLVSPDSFPTSAVAGYPIEITWEISNNGNLSTDTTWRNDRIYLSTNLIFEEATSFYLGGVYDSTELSPGESYLETATFDLPADISGDYYIFILTDYYNNIRESNENNNIDRSTSTINIYLDLPEAPFNPDPQDGESNVRIDGDLSWQGSPSTSTFDLYLWEDGQEKPASPTISYLTNVSYDPPSNFITGSTYYWQVVAKNVMGEVSGPEWSFTAELLPDLQVTQITIPPIAYSGQPIQLSWIVTNNGDGRTTVTTWYDRVYITQNPIFDQQFSTLLGQISNPAYLDPGESYQNTGTFALQEGISGEYYVFVITNTYNFMRELDNSNNSGRSETTFEISLTPPPDLQVTSVSGPPNAFSGDPINVNWVIENKGLGITPGISWSDSIYLSPDTQFDEGEDYYLGTQNHTGALASGESYSGTAEVNLPHAIYGEYHLFVVTDITDVIYENVWEENNTSDPSDPITITLTPPPDLEVTSLSVPLSANSGEVIEVSWEVQNHGPGEPFETYWQDQVYLSPSQEFNLIEAIDLGTVSHFGGLAAGSSYARNRSLTLPNGLSGSYYIHVHTDYDDRVFEFIYEDNNITVSEPILLTLLPSPDFLVTNVSGPETGTAGSPISISWTVTNQSDDAPNSLWRDRVYIWTSSSWDGNGIVLGTFDRPKVLTGGESYTHTRNFVLPNSLFGAPYYVYVFTDYTDIVYEHDGEDNNIGQSAAMVIAPLSSYSPTDLIIGDLTGPSTGASGQPVEVSWTVTNTSEYTTQATSWTDGIYLSTDTNLDTDNDPLLLAQSHRGALTTSSAYTQTRLINLPNGIEGEHFLFFSTDINEQVNDDKRDNNTAYLITPISITISPSPDLQMILNTTTDNALSGQPIELNWSVTNLGAANSTGIWYDAVYLSADSILDPFDEQLASFYSGGGLEIGGTYTSTEYVTIPSQIIGNYFLLVKTDSRNDVYEHNAEDNNVVSWLININEPPPTDLVVDWVTVPISATAGSPITIEWGIRNQGEWNASGYLCDAVFISIDAVWDISDARLADQCYTIDLPAGSAVQLEFQALMLDSNILEAMTSSISGNMPGVTPGAYYAIVRTDILNQIPESNELNNSGSSIETILLDVETIELGVPVNGTIGSGEGRFFKLNVPGGETLLVSMTSQSTTAANEVYVSYEKVPNRGSFEYSHNQPQQPNQEVIVPTTQEGDYYIYLYSAGFPEQTSQYTLETRLLNFELRHVQPTEGGQGGRVTVRLDGSRMGTSTNARLINNGVIIDASVFYLYNPSLAYATFDLSNAPIGTYDVQIEDGDFNALLPNNFEVVKGSQGDVAARYEFPASVRRGQYGLLVLEYFNPGSTDVNSPTFKISAENAVLRTTEQSDFAPTILVHANQHNGPSTILSPGAVGQINVYFTPSISTGGTIKFSISRLIYDQQVQLASNIPSEDLSVSTLTTLPVEGLASLDKKDNEGLIKSILEEQIKVPEQTIDSTDQLRGISIENQDFLATEMFFLEDIDAYLRSQPGPLKDYYAEFDGQRITAAELIWEASLVEDDLFEEQKSVGLDFDLNPKLLISVLDGLYGVVSVASTEDSSALAEKYELLNPQKLFDFANTLGREYINSYTNLPVDKKHLAATNAIETSVSSVPSPQLSRDMDKKLSSADALHSSYESLFALPSSLQLSESNAEGEFTIPELIKPVDASAGWLFDHGEQQFIFTGDYKNMAEVDEKYYVGHRGYDYWPPVGTELVASYSGYLIHRNRPSTNECSSTTYYANLIIDLNNDGKRDLQLRYDHIQEVEDKSGEISTGEPVGIVGKTGTCDVHLHFEVGRYFNDNDVNIDNNRYMGEHSSLRDPFGWWGSEVDHSAKNPDELDTWLWKTSDISDDEDDSFQIFDWRGGHVAEPSSIGIGGRSWYSHDVNEFAVWGLKAPTAGDYYIEVNIPNIPDKIYKFNAKYKIFDQSEPTKRFQFDQQANRGDGSINWVPLEIDGERILVHLEENEMMIVVGETPDNISSTVMVYDAVRLVPANPTSIVEEIPILEGLINVIIAVDPNDIIGPGGYGDAQWVGIERPLSYTIRFENDETKADAPAQRVVIEQVLDSDLDQRSIRLGTFGFGGRIFEVPENLSHYQTRLDLVEDIGLFVDVTAGIDLVNGKAFWILQSIDPATGEPPTDADAGFLPPDVIDGEGQGFVSYYIKPKTTVQTGDIVDALATIIFDNNDPIDTASIFNTIDPIPPSSLMDPLNPEIMGDEVILSWDSSDDDEGSGLKDVDLYVSVDGDLFTLWKADILESVFVFSGEPGHTYGFFTQAEDNAGNREFSKNAAEATTLLYLPNQPSIIELTSDPTSLIADGISTSIISAVVLDGEGNHLVDQTVEFTSTLGSLNEMSVLTDEFGVATTTFTAPITTGISSVTAQSGNAQNSISIVIVDEQITGLSVEDDSPTLLGIATTLSASVATGTNVSYGWDFGDGTTGSGAVVNHTYLVAGNYTASVTASNSVSQLTETKIISIISEDEPINGLTASNDSPTALGDEATLNASITEGTNVTFTWDFGDGSSGEGAHVTHTYLDKGVYTASVTAANDISSSTETTEIIIMEAIAGLSASNDSPTSLDMVTTLSATITAGSDLTFEWDYGDGNSGEGDIVTHTYQSAGVYTATVTASNAVSEQIASTEIIINTLPFAEDDTASVQEDSVIDIPVLDNDSDPDGDPISISEVTDPANGTAALSQDETIQFTPDENYCGNDSFTYTITDGRSGTATAGVTIEVTCVNDEPIAEDDSYTTDEDSSLDIVIPGVLGNDSDVDGDSLTVSSIDASSTLGLVSVNPDGSFSYDPDGQFNYLAPRETATDSFMYSVSDGSGGIDTAKVSVTINGVNSNPVAEDDTYSGTEDTILAIDPSGVLLNDSDIEGDSISIDSNTQPENGLVSLGEDGSFTYTPNADFCGIDTFFYTISDGNGGLGTATVNIDVTCINDDPIAEDDSISTDEDIPLDIAIPGVLGNDSDVDGDTLSVSSFDASGSLGVVLVNPDGSGFYDPDGQFEYLAPGETAMDTFFYSITDGNGGADSAEVIITIDGVNDAPEISVDPSSIGAQYSDDIPSISITVQDIDTVSLEISTIDFPAGLSLSSPTCSGIHPVICSATINGYADVPAGTYDFTINVSDGELSSSANVTLTVTPEISQVEFGDDNPVAVLVVTPGGNSGAFDLVLNINEGIPDTPLDLALPGDINLAQAGMTIVPVGPGSPATPLTCSRNVSGSGYDGVLEVICSFDDIPVNTYTVEVNINGGYYQAYNENVLVIYDPSLGFTTGGGWFYWPDTTDKTNFGYTMKYNKKGQKVKGSLLLIRHLPDGSKYRVKSNALYGLALGESEDFGWASFSGKSTYLQPGWLEPEGNHEFLVYVEDHNEPGTGVDRFWIQVLDKQRIVIEALSMFEPAVDNAIEINGGNIFAPHGGGGKKAAN